MIPDRHSLDLDEIVKDHNYITGVENALSSANILVDHLVKVVDSHRTRGECPTYCFGAHYRTDVNHAVDQDPLWMIAALYVACVRLAGHDSH